MQETSVPSESDFFVEWQLVDGPEDLIDLTTAESEALQPDPALLSPLETTVPAHR